MRAKIASQISPSIPEFVERPMHPCEAGLQLFSPRGVYVTSYGHTTHVRLVAATLGGYHLFLDGEPSRFYLRMAAAVKAAVTHHGCKVSQPSAA